jgi:predicted nuclease of predicted toxin-antitoxin system
MKFLADENIPLGAVKKLRELGFEIGSITEECPGLPDEEVLRVSVVRKVVLITFDKDFGRLVFKRKEKFFGIVLLRIPPKSPDFIFERLKSLLHSEIKFERKFVVMREDKVRVISVA